MADKAEPIPVKEDADTLVLEALSDQKVHQYHVGRKDPLRKATEIYAGLELHDLARQTNFDVNIFSYALGNTLRSHGYDKKMEAFWSIRFGQR